MMNTRKKIRRFSSASLSYLRNYEWPGNVRELRNRVQRAIIMSDAASIEPDDLGCEMQLSELLQSQSESSVVSLKEAKDKVERELVASAIERQKGNIVKAAEELGVSRPTLYDLMKKHQLTPLASVTKAS